MNDFLNKISGAINSMGVAPYDDNKTRDAMVLATRKVVKHCEELTIIKKENDNK